MISDQTKAVAAASGAAALAVAISTAVPQRAYADVVAYIVNVTVRPGYDFPTAEEALGYGRGICDKAASGRSYAHLIDAINSDFHTSDEFQASHLITQAANELSPATIWQLRNSASGYRSEARL